MKLVEILARELESWPDKYDTLAISQDGSGDLNRLDAGVFPENAAPVPRTWESWPSRTWTSFSDISVSKTASDWRDAIVTKSKWQSARDKLKGETKVPKPNKDGWIRHRGGECPVEDGELVDVRLANGDIYKGDKASDWGWNHEDCMREFRLVAWRPHKAEQPSLSSVAADGELWSDAKEIRSVEALSPSLYIQQVGRAYRHEGDPRKMRDRIREIDAASKEEEARHCAAMAAYDAERTSLVARLKAEGFVLIQGDEPNSVVESAQQDIAQQDMSDPANWRVGDIFVIVENMKDDHEFAEGTIVRLTSFDDGQDGYIGTFEYQDGSDYWFCKKESVKWHSRPPNNL